MANVGGVQRAVEAADQKAWNARRVWPGDAYIGVTVRGLQLREPDAIELVENEIQRQDHSDEHPDEQPEAQAETVITNSQNSMRLSR